MGPRLQNVAILGHFGEGFESILDVLFDTIWFNVKCSFVQDSSVQQLWNIGFYNAPALNALPVHLLRQVFLEALKHSK